MRRPICLSYPPITKGSETSSSRPWPAGTPVVSTDCPSGPAEILENGKWGRLTPVGNADALAEAMRASLEDDHDTAALKRRAADFAPEIAARKYLKLLDL